MSQPQAETIPLLPLVPPNDGVIPFRVAHSDMQPGDLLFWRGDYWISREFERWTNSYYSHAAIAARWDGQLMLMQAEALGIQAVPLHVTIARYPGLVDWYTLTPEARRVVNVPLVLERARHCLGMRYGYLEVARALAYRVFGIGDPHDPKRPRAMFCSEFVAYAFAASNGFSFYDKPAIDTFPQDIAGATQWVRRIGCIHPDPTMPRPARNPPPPSAEPAQPVDRVAEGPDGARLQAAGGGGERDDVPMQ